MSCDLEKKQIINYVQEFGSPLYIFHSGEFKKNYINLLNTMRNYYPKYNVAYSYKTNYTPKILELVKGFGGMAEVVSEMEYNLAKKIGYTSKEIIFNGPVKGKGLFNMILDGGIANIDSLDELCLVIELAEKNPDLEIKIAFRVNIDIEQGFVSRFGLDAYEDVSETSELDDAFKRVEKQKNIEVVGLHCHIGRSRGITAWENRVRIMFTLIDRYFKKEPLFLDFGSGMNSVMEPILRSQFAENVPTFEEYAKVVAGAMKEKYGSLPLEKQPNLYTEPGTTLISGCMSFLGTVESIKTVKNKSFVTFDCSGGNIGDICKLKKLPISVFHMGAKRRKIENASFVGYTCLEHDHIYEGYSGELAVGDVIQFRNIGSYSNVFKPPFILPNCAMIEIDDYGSASLIKKSETFDDIFRTYVFER